VVSEKTADGNGQQVLTFLKGFGVAVEYLQIGRDGGTAEVLHVPDQPLFDPSSHPAISSPGAVETVKNHVELIIIHVGGKTC
jgi:hypothetical protein